MPRSLTRSHALITPLVILLVVFVEELLVYELRLEVTDVYLRTVLVMLLYGPAIAFVAEVLSPRVKKLFVALRSRSRRTGGRMGIAAFFAAAYAVAFYGYFILETKGPGALVP